jgi:transcriptional regulator with XRE-family HTH domain
MALLPNYLRTHRKRQTLSQEEVAFLLGVNGMDKGIKVSRDENLAREPSLRTAIAYEAIYGKPVRELFAGLYEQVEQEVAERAKLLGYRKTIKSKNKRQEVIANLISKIIK